MPERIIRIRVVPRASRNAVCDDGAASYRIYTTAAPADGAANAAVIKMLAKHMGVAKTSMRITRGHTSRDKVIVIND